LNHVQLVFLVYHYLMRPKTTFEGLVDQETIFSICIIIFVAHQKLSKAIINTMSVLYKVCK
jgi:hypothetical protein